VLQLSYEPAGGVPQLFNLRIIAVESGFLNLGIQYENGKIAVYNDLGPGLWALEGAERINRVTLECPSGESCPSIEVLHEMFRTQSLSIEPLEVPPPDPKEATYCCKHYDPKTKKGAG
jgi:hypothetical protein